MSAIKSTSSTNKVLLVWAVLLLVVFNSPTNVASNSQHSVESSTGK